MELFCAFRAFDMIWIARPCRTFGSPSLSTSHQNPTNKIQQPISTSIPRSCAQDNASSRHISKINLKVSEYITKLSTKSQIDSARHNNEQTQNVRTNATQLTQHSLLRRLRNEPMITQRTSSGEKVMLDQCAPNLMIQQRHNDKTTERPATTRVARRL